MERLCARLGCRVDELIEFVPDDAVAKREK
jgi:DNA-binding Xre family transcriptional regulator